MAALIPFGISALGALPGLIGGIMSIAEQAKRSRGGRIKICIPRRGKGLAPMYIQRPYVGQGLLAPAGGTLTHRRGHLRKVPGSSHKIRIAPTVVRSGRGRGVVADTFGAIPMIGTLLGPLARSLGGKAGPITSAQRTALARQLGKLRGRGLAPMYIQRPYVGQGLRPYAKGGATRRVVKKKH